MGITRIPLIWPWNSRYPDTDRDPRMLNVMVEQANDVNYVLKRPGTQILYSYPPGTGQGITYYNGATYAVVSDQLRVSSSNYSGTTGTTWISTGPSDWSARSSFGTVNVQGTIYVVGGLIDTGAVLNTPSSDVWSITPGTGWQLCTGSAPWSARAEMSLVNMFSGTDKAIIMIGGVADGPTPLNDVWASPDGVTWTQLVEEGPWAPRYGASSFLYNGNIYLMGGTDGAQVFNDIWVSIDAVTWVELIPNADWPARAFAASYVYPINNVPAIWIAGGADVAGNGISSVWASSDGGKNWVEKNSSAFAAGGIYAAGYLVYNDKMWLVNGRTGPTVGTAIADVYNSTDGITWTRVTTMGPWQPSCSGALVVFPTPTSISSYNYQSMYWLGGENASAVKTNTGALATLDIVLSLGGFINPAVADQPFQFAPFQEGQLLLVKNQCGMWIVAGGRITQVKSNGYPLETVPGLVVLGTFAYVMDRSGLIHCCEADNPYIWPLLNAVGADYESDPGVALTKYLNYVIAFGTYTCQFFYDAGKPVGSPLLPYLNANSRVGCAAAETVVDMGPTIMWVGRTLQYNRQVYMMNGMTPQVVSTPAIDKLLNASGWGTIFAFNYYADGHLFYVVSGFTSKSWAYDLSTKLWFEWTDDTGSTALTYSGSASNLDLNGFMIQSLTTGSVYKVSGEYFDDDGAPFPVQIVTGKVDFGNNARKFYGYTQLICDQNVGEVIIETTDNDYRSYGPGRFVDTETQRPGLSRCGSGRRRAWRLTMINSERMRWESLEVNVEQGSVQNGLAGG